jgi:tRNA uridine 5-carboxymethylaminomethyl modification enzyme
MAGLNAALKVGGKPAFTLDRAQAYIGVMIDDLITRGVSEPYRMFTSRAEYRLSLREDNADLRLTDIGRSLGLVDDARWSAYARKRDTIDRELARLKATWAHPRCVADVEALRVLGQSLEREYTLFDLLKRPSVSYDRLRTLVNCDGAPLGAPAGDVDDAAAEQVEIATKYAGYIARQRDEVARHGSHESTRIPATIDYDVVRGLSIEVRQKLKQHRPETVGQAGRISGLTPAAISLLLVHLKRIQRAGAMAPPTAPNGQRAA